MKRGASGSRRSDGLFWFLVLDETLIIVRKHWWSGLCRIWDL